MSSLTEQYAAQRRWRPWPQVYDLLGDLRGLRVLDLGCALGDQAADLAARGAAVVGVDLNEELLAAARARDLPGVRFLRADLREPLDPSLARALAPAQRAFDGLWLGFSAAYFPAIDEALGRWSTALRPGGWIAVTEVDDLLGHEPIPAGDREAVEAFYADARAAGTYDFRLRAPLRAALRRRGWRIRCDRELADPEFSCAGPASPAIRAAWAARLERMPQLRASAPPGFAARLLGALAAPEHRSSATLWTIVADAPGPGEEP